MSIDAKEIEPGALEAVLRSVEDINPQSMWVFGSVTAPNWDPTQNDVDLFVLSEEFKRVRFRSREQLLNSPPGLSFDTWLYTPSEFESLFPKESVFYMTMNKTKLEITPHLRNK